MNVTFNKSLFACMYSHNADGESIIYSENLLRSIVRKCLTFISKPNALSF